MTVLNPNDIDSVRRRSEVNNVRESAQQFGAHFAVENGVALGVFPNRSKRISKVGEKLIS
jgi:hypothetical protein